MKLATVPDLIKAICENRRGDSVVIPYTEYKNVTLLTGAAMHEDDATRLAIEEAHPQLVQLFMLPGTLRTTDESTRRAIEDAHPLFLTLLDEVVKDAPYSSDDLIVRLRVSCRDTSNTVRLELIAITLDPPNGRLRSIGVTAVNTVYDVSKVVMGRRHDSWNLLKGGSLWTSFDDLPSLLRLIYD